MSDTDIAKAGVAALVDLRKAVRLFFTSGVDDWSILTVKTQDTKTIIAALELLSPVAAGTHVIVPKEPSEAMSYAGFEALSTDFPCECDQCEVYRAMIEAAL